jgi:hypothetical protein
MIKSSELKQWSFCPREWFLLRTRRIKINNIHTKRGLEFHNKQAKGIRSIKRTQNQLVFLLATGGALCLLLLLLRLL